MTTIPEIFGHLALWEALKKKVEAKVSYENISKWLSEQYELASENGLQNFAIDIQSCQMGFTLGFAVKQNQILDQLEATTKELLNRAEVLYGEKNA